MIPCIHGVIRGSRVVPCGRPTERGSYTCPYHEAWEMNPRHVHDGIGAMCMGMGVIPDRWVAGIILPPGSVQDSYQVDL